MELSVEQRVKIWWTAIDLVILMSESLCFSVFLPLMSSYDYHVLNLIVCFAWFLWFVQMMTSVTVSKVAEFFHYVAAVFLTMIELYAFIVLWPGTVITEVYWFVIPILGWACFVLGMICGAIANPLDEPSTRIHAH